MDIRGSLEASFLARLGRPIPGPFGHFAPFGVVPFMSNYSIDNLMSHHQQHHSPTTTPATQSAFFPHQQQSPQLQQQPPRDQHVDSKGECSLLSSLVPRLPPLVTPFLLPSLHAIVTSLTRLPLFPWPF